MTLPGKPSNRQDSLYVLDLQHRILHLKLGSFEAESELGFRGQCFIEGGFSGEEEGRRRTGQGKQGVGSAGVWVPPAPMESPGHQVQSADHTWGKRTGIVYPCQSAVG